MALPRVKVVLARAARLVTEGALARRAERTAVVRSIAADMLDCIEHEYYCMYNVVQEVEPNGIQASRTLNKVLIM